MLELDRVVQAVRFGHVGRPVPEMGHERATGLQQRTPVDRYEGALQRREHGRPDRQVDFLVGLVSHDRALLEPGEIYAASPERLELARRPPEMPSPEGGDEVRQLVPEPEEDLQGRRFLVHRIDALSAECDAVEDPPPIEEGPVRTCIDVVEPARASEEDLTFGAVRKHEEHDAGQPEVLEEERFSEASDEFRSARDDIFVRLVLHDHAKVEVRVFVRFSPRMRASEEARDDPFVARTERRESVDDGLRIPPRTSLATSRSFSGRAYAVLGVDQPEILE